MVGRACTAWRVRCRCCNPQGGILLLDNSDCTQYQEAFDMVPSWWLKVLGRRIKQATACLTCAEPSGDMRCWLNRVCLASDAAVPCFIAACAFLSVTCIWSLPCPTPRVSPLLRHLTCFAFRGPCDHGEQTTIWVSCLPGKCSKESGSAKLAAKSLIRWHRLDALAS